LSAGIVWLLGISLAAVSWADSVILTSVADTTLIETEPNNNLGGQLFANSGTTQNYTRNHALFRFDLAGLLPPNATITGVSLALEVTQQPRDGYTPSQFSLHRVLRSWGEGNKTAAEGNSPGLGAPATLGEVTWLQRFAFTSETWGLPGGEAGVDYEPAASSSTYIYGTGDSPYTFPSETAMVQDAQYWLDHPESNFGWMLITDSESDNFTARRFGSHEDPDHTPLLFVDFVVVPEPNSWALWAVGLTVAFGAVRGRSKAGASCRYDRSARRHFVRWWYQATQARPARGSASSK
jgi:hypothetical protein